MCRGTEGWRSRRTHCRLERSHRPPGSGYLLDVSMVVDRAGKWDIFTDHDSISVEAPARKISYACYINSVCVIGSTDGFSDRSGYTKLGFAHAAAGSSKTDWGDICLMLRPEFI